MLYVLDARNGEELWSSGGRDHVLEPLERTVSREWAGLPRNLRRHCLVLRNREMMPALVLGLLAAATTVGAQTDRIAGLEQRVEAQRKLIRDWGGLIRYGSANAELGPPKQGEHRVVFFGDDATEHWGRGTSEFFPGRPYINRGIAGQSTPQLLVRFRQDVVALKPKAVVIQGGMHDISGRAVPGTRGMIAEHFESMVDIAEMNRIRVIVASLLPVCECGSPLAPLPATRTDLRTK